MLHKSFSNTKKGILIDFLLEKYVLMCLSAGMNGWIFSGIKNLIADN
jgi:hypothetical protein